MAEFTEYYAYKLYRELCELILNDEQDIFDKDELVKSTQDTLIMGLFTGYCLGKGVSVDDFNEVVGTQGALADIVRAYYDQ